MASNGNGNGHGQQHPKWQSHIDQWVREILETMGGRVHQLKLAKKEMATAQTAMADALIYAGCTILFDTADQDQDKTEELIKESVEKFTSDFDSHKDDEEGEDNLN